VISTSEEFASENGLIPIARIVGYGEGGCDPSVFRLRQLKQLRKR
jgi:acetyl-CoA acetyltransferase